MRRPHPLLSLWLEALNEPFGLAVTTTNPPQLTRLLNSLRERSPPEIRALIANLQIRTSPRRPETELWVVNPDGAPREDEDTPQESEP